MRRLATTLFAISMVWMAIGCAGTRVDGTYVLVSRTLPDGTVQTPPTVSGLITLSDGIRNTNVFWKDANGRNVSVSSVAEFEITEYRYSETNVLYVTNNPGGGALTYDMADIRGDSEIVYTERGMRFELPLHDEPVVEFTEDGFTATRVGEFVDRWRKIGKVREDEAKRQAAEERAAREAAEARAAAEAEAEAAEDAAQAEEPQK